MNGASVIQFPNSISNGLQSERLAGIYARVRTMEDFLLDRAAGCSSEWHSVLILRGDRLPKTDGVHLITWDRGVDVKFGKVLQGKGYRRMLWSVRDGNTLHLRGNGWTSSIAIVGAALRCPRCCETHPELILRHYGYGPECHCGEPFTNLDGTTFDRYHLSKALGQTVGPYWLPQFQQHRDLAESMVDSGRASRSQHNRA